MKRLSVYHRKDGRWEGRISKGKDKHGKRKFLYIIDRSKEQVISRMKEIYKREQPNEKCDKTLTIIFNEWFQGVQHIVKSSTACNYRMKAEKHILPAFGNCGISTINQDSIYSFISQKQTSGLSYRYIADIIVLMKSIFKYAVKTYRILNPLEGIVIPKKKANEIRLLDEVEQGKLQKYVRSHQNRSTLGVTLSYYTGIRIGELCALQWKDIDLEKRILTVNKTIQRIQMPTISTKTQLVITEPKSDSSCRKIPVPDCIIDFLKKFMGNSDDFVLSGIKKPIEPRAMQYRFCTVLKNAELPSIHFHALRHIFASNCVKLGVDIKALSEILGHSTVEITLNRYVHSSFETKRAYMNRLKFNF